MNDFKHEKDGMRKYEALCSYLTLNKALIGRPLQDEKYYKSGRILPPERHPAPSSHRSFPVLTAPGAN